MARKPKAQTWVGYAATKLLPDGEQIDISTLTREAAACQDIVTARHIRDARPILRGQVAPYHRVVPVRIAMA